MQIADLEIINYDCVDCKRTLPKEEYYWQPRKTQDGGRVFIVSTESQGLELLK